MDTKGKAIAIITSIVVLGILLLVFVPMNEMSKELDTELITPETANTTPFVTADGELPRFNEISHFFLSNIWWIVVIGIVIFIIIGFGRISRGDAGQ